MRLAAAGTILIAVLIALTLLPTLLGFAGTRAGRAHHSGPAGMRWAAIVTRRARCSACRTGPVISFLPIAMVATLFGLAVDYHVFLVSRMRESYVTTHNPAGAVTSGFGAAARVVTAAAIIMIFVFGSFIFGGQPAIKAIGLAFAFGILADAFLVRMTLVPALLKLLGHAAWNLPGPVDRLLPNLDIEGGRIAEER
jgi:uncharacterized membrane protein YdfJ with MMPL/SSD domain